MFFFYLIFFIDNLILNANQNYQNMDNKSLLDLIDTEIMLELAGKIITTESIYSDSKNENKTKFTYTSDNKVIVTINQNQTLKIIKVKIIILLFLLLIMIK